MTLDTLNLISVGIITSLISVTKIQSRVPKTWVITLISVSNPIKK